MDGPVREKVERWMVERLNHEWRRVIQDLVWRCPEWKGVLSPPSIVIRDMTAALGVWHNDLKEIRISRRLVEDGRWDSVCEVLHHEIAHQMAFCIEAQQNQPPHGPVFQECCRKIQANPRASGGYRTLEERVWDDKEEAPDRIMARVRKLMRLAASKNPHEAAAAAAKANELITRYNVDLIRQDHPRTFESVMITGPVIKRSQAAMIATVILNTFYFVETIWVPAWIPDRQRMGTVLEITGTPANLRIADYVFHYLLDYAQREWQRYRRDHPRCRSRSGFMTGVVSGFREKLEKERWKRETTSNASGPDRSASSRAVIPRDRQLKACFHQRHPRIRIRRVHHATASLSAFESGRSRGKQLTVSKGVEAPAKNSGRLIG